MMMAAILSITVWRASSLSSKLRINDVSVGATKGWKRRCIIFKEFLFLILDILCLAPLSLVVATLYRFPDFIIAMKNAARNVVPMNENSKYDVLNVSYDFFEKGGATLNVSLRKALSKKELVSESEENAGTLGVRNQAHGTTQGDIDIVDDTIHMHVLGHLTPIVNGVNGTEYKYTVWNMATKLFGSLMTNVCKSYLPLKLRDNKECNLSPFKENNDTPLRLDIDLGIMIIHKSAIITYTHINTIMYIDVITLM